jgi:intron-binding protein aquarius
LNPITQAVAQLYFAHPDQRTIVVSRSNKAIDHFLSALLERGVEEMHVVRLGGFSKLTRDDSTFSFDFSADGRLNVCLSTRLHLLANIQELGNRLGEVENMHVGDVGYSCETVHAFYHQHIAFRLERWSEQDQALFASVPVFLTRAVSLKQAVERVFATIESLRWTEFLRTDQQRTEYLASRFARVVFLTSTHAARARDRLIRAGFSYENVVLLESEQMTEVEGFVPLNIQADPAHTIKRVLVVGEKERLEQKRLSPQSLGDRLHRLYGFYPSFGSQKDDDEEKEGKNKRVRRQKVDFSVVLPFLRHLALSSSSSSSEEQAFVIPPSSKLPTLSKQVQFLECGEYQGQGREQEDEDEEDEEEEERWFHTGEAEFLVALYMYLRLQGIPEREIGLFAATEAQKRQVEQVLLHRCSHDMFGLPSHLFSVSEVPEEEEVLVELSVTLFSTAGPLSSKAESVLARLERSTTKGLFVFGRKDELQLSEQKGGEQQSSLFLKFVLPSASGKLALDQEGELENGVDDLGAKVHAIATKQYEDMVKAHQRQNVMPEEEKET